MVRRLPIINRSYHNFHTNFQIIITTVTYLHSDQTQSSSISMITVMLLYQYLPNIFKYGCNLGT